MTDEELRAEFAAMHMKIDALPTTVSIEFIANQQLRIIDRLGAIEDQITVLTGMAIRHDGALNGLATEFRGLAQAVSRIDHRVRKLEDH